ncbi:ABC transporter ATP-binding protein [Pseudovibrio sp. WM33]|uniref:ABC transporter ATP-binding protein n=2 Tax=Pseudovibrio TaxID=258255 RepID=UPI00128FFC46|nr:ABC transporter ATP-binding protein [Pseudovibrio sp. WM33]
MSAINIEKVFRNGSADSNYCVLRGVNISINEGEYSALLGPSGSGKSTLLSILGLLDRPSSGTLYFNGVDTSSINDKQMARYRNGSLGFVFQSFHLIERYTVWENVGLPLLYSGINRQRQFKASCHVLNMVGLADHKHKLPSQLSGGQRQRVAIARALINHPKLLLADEPTGNLDQRTAQEILSLLEFLNREKNLSILIVTHDLSIAERCNKQFRIRDGVISDCRC